MFTMCLLLLETSLGLEGRDGEWRRPSPCFVRTHNGGRRGGLSLEFISEIQPQGQSGATYLSGSSPPPDLPQIYCCPVQCWLPPTCGCHCVLSICFTHLCSYHCPENSGSTLSRKQKATAQRLPEQSFKSHVWEHCRGPPSGRQPGIEAKGETGACLGEPGTQPEDCPLFLVT